MNILETHSKIIDDYASYIRSFINIADAEILKKVNHDLTEGKLWPQPLLQFNPAYEMAGSIESIAAEDSMTPISRTSSRGINCTAINGMRSSWEHLAVTSSLPPAPDQANHSPTSDRSSIIFLHTPPPKESRPSSCTR